MFRIWAFGSGLSEHSSLFDTEGLDLALDTAYLADNEFIIYEG